MNIHLIYKTKGNGFISSWNIHNKYLFYRDTFYMEFDLYQSLIGT